MFEMCENFRHGDMMTQTVSVISAPEQMDFIDLYFDRNYLVRLKEGGIENPSGMQVWFVMSLDQGNFLTPELRVHDQITPPNSMSLIIHGKKYPDALSTFTERVGVLEDGPLTPRKIGKITYTGEKRLGYESIQLEFENEYSKSHLDHFVQTNWDGEIESILSCMKQPKDSKFYCHVIEQTDNLTWNMFINQKDIGKLKQALNSARNFVACLTEKG